MGWASPGGASAGESDLAPVVVLRVCGNLDAESVIGMFGARFPQVRIVPDDQGGATTPWLAELCTDGEMLVSTLTNTDTGASSTQTWPVPGDAGERGLERLAAHILGSQIRGAFEAASAAIPFSEGADAMEGDAALEDDEAGLEVDLFLVVGFESVGGLTHRTDEASIGIGPGFLAGAILARNGIIALGVRALTVLGVGAGMDLLETLPLSIGGGWNAPLGPVDLQAVLEVIAERWSPSGADWGGGWRAGLGARCGLVVPLAWLLDFRLDFGVEYFTEGHSLGYGPVTSGGIIADLSNLRWRASAGLELRIPLS
ncbi:MAG: hypothetical protein HY905_24615 [Deltaproteobacteria bacterium]|nr:hypothetical protein [Deltaproteobacteria bacterium]